MTSNYPADHDPILDDGLEPIEEVPEFDDSDDYRENLPPRDQFGVDLGLPDGDTHVEIITDEDPLGLGL